MTIASFHQNLTSAPCTNTTNTTQHTTLQNYAQSMLSFVCLNIDVYSEVVVNATPTIIPIKITFFHQSNVFKSTFFHTTKFFNLKRARRVFEASNLKIFYVKKQWSSKKISLVKTHRYLKKTTPHSYFNKTTKYDST